MYLEKLTSLTNADKVAIIGLGQENLQFLEWVTNVVGVKPSQILLADRKPFDLSNPILQDFSSYPDHLFCGENYLEILKNQDIKLVIKAPGMWSLNPAFEDFRQTHGQDSILSSLVFFFERYCDQIIAITGTKGKSTTSSLLNHLLKSASSVTSHYCGNTTNISPYQFWTDLDQPINPSEFFVIETSSFQLQDLDYAKLSPKYGIITNYFIDHQDQHATPEEYWRAKDTIFAHQLTSGSTLITDTVAQKTQLKHKLDRTFLVTSDLAQDISSLFYTNLEGTHNQSNLAQAIITYLKVTTSLSNENQSKESILDLLNQQIEPIQSALSSYQPLAHRQELVATFDSQINIQTKTVDKTVDLTVRFIDDGAATEPDAVIAAINTLTNHPHKYIWLFIAGKNKGVQLDGITQAILETQLQNRLFRIHYCGQIGQNILTHLYHSLGAKLQAPFETFKKTITDELTSQNQIVAEFQAWLTDQVSQLEELNEQAKIQEILSATIELNITLSPCGSSQDEFTNYIERADWFQEQVKNIVG